MSFSRALAMLRACANAALAAGLAAPVATVQAQVGEADLKAAFAYNFVVLAKWPDETGTAVRLCIAGVSQPPDAFRPLHGKVARERVLTIVAVPTPDRIAECHALYIPRAETARLATWLSAVGRLPILTITEGAALPGAMLNLRLMGSQVVFDVDTRPAAAVNISLSSQLLKLAASRQ